MKQILQRATSVLLVLCVMLALFSPTVYAQNSNVRGTVCTELSAKAQAYYTGSYTYEVMSALEGGTDNCLTTVNCELYQRLSSLMSDTMTNSVTYKKLTTYWPTTDNSIFFYSDTGYSGTVSREHVWPKSRASFYQSGGGCDLHHLRPENNNINSSRGNYTFGNVRGVISDCSTDSFGGKTVLWYSKSADLVEVNDNIKGDVARILLYVYVRWGEPNLFMNTPDPVIGPGDDANNGRKVIESLDTLLQWCEMDPVDTWEMSRNDEVQSVQGNRNVFIDYPEYAWLLFGEELPSDMTTPSGEAADHGTCAHESTHEVTTDPTCEKDGKVETVCDDCGEVVETKTLAKLGHDYKAVTVAPTCTEKGYDLYTCARCGDDYKKKYTDALGHDYVCGVCKRCGEEDPDYVAPVLSFTDVPEGEWYVDAVNYVVENGLMNGMGKNEFRPEEAMTRAMLVTVLWRYADSPAEGENTFLDLTQDWYVQAVAWASSNGIVTGYPDGTFRPDEKVTREQLATIIYRYCNTSGIDTGARADLTAFPDAKDVNSYASDAISWAVSVGLITGITHGSNATKYLEPQTSAIRAQVATILMRFIEKVDG